MKNTLFLMTHLASGWESLAAKLEECPSIHVFQTNLSYHHPDDIIALKKNSHKRKNSTSIWADVIFHNKDFTMKRLCNYYNFIFWSCDLEDCLEELIQKNNYSKEQAKNYWNYRNEGLRQYYKRCRNSLWNPELNIETILSSIFR